MASTTLADVPRIVATAHEHATDAALGSRLHGPRHWRDVARVGLRLHRLGVDCDPLVVFLFALLHDTQRLSDGRDPEHGIRASEAAAAMRAQGVLTLTDEQAHTLCDALELHADGYLGDSPTEAACWDADRLTLWRVGITPSARLLSTSEARGLIEWARDHVVYGRDATWVDIAAGFCE